MSNSDTQGHSQGHTKSQFAVWLSPARDGMPEAPTEAEAQAVSAHFAYYQGLRADRKLILAGRTTEPPFAGVMVFEAAGLEEAERIAHEDPGVVAGVFVARVQPFRVALLRDPACNSRSLAVGLFNRTWELLGQPERTPEETDELIHGVHASARHWLDAGGPTQACQAHWMCGRVWAHLGQGEAALLHARRCREVAEGHGLSDFELAIADEIESRALLAAGRGDEARAALARLRAAHDASEDEDVREVLMRDLVELEGMLVSVG